MCIFSREVQRVADTSIFARPSKEGRQFLVYSMTVATKDELAMILPLPVPKGTKEDGVKFINLEKYPTIFDDLWRLFPIRRSITRSRSAKEDDAKPEKLKVIEVGSFEASFAPTLTDMDRLDERFKLPRDVWKKVARYDAYGFAVFKLKKGELNVHPMAFEFPRANAKQIYFPTVHIHDGKVHDRAVFDHALYLQFSGDDTPSMFDWEESPGHAQGKVEIDKTQGIVRADAHVYRRELRGRYKNDDVVV